jgi:hypothetical protein
VNRDVGQWVSPIVAVVVLAVVTAQIFAALQVTGAFGWHAAAPRVLTSPAYRSLDRAIDRHDPSFTLEGLRDPFVYGASGAHDGTDPPLPRRPKPAPPVVLAVPVLTAIVWDSDPRALIRWNEREWTVREGGLFDEFQVVRITRDHVTLRRGEETLELHRRNPGE